jgi:hypothetical protein
MGKARKIKERREKESLSTPALLCSVIHFWDE